MVAAGTERGEVSHWDVEETGCRRMGCGRDALGNPEPTIRTTKTAARVGLRGR